MVDENGACWVMEDLGSTYGATEMAVPLDVGRQTSVSKRGWALQVAVRGLRSPGPRGVGQGGDEVLRVYRRRPSIESISKEQITRVLRILVLDLIDL